MNIRKIVKEHIRKYRDTHRMLVEYDRGKRKFTRKDMGRLAKFIPERW